MIAAVAGGRHRLRPPVGFLDARYTPAVLLLAFGAAVVLPTWLALPPDDEGLAIEIVTTKFQQATLALSQYPFWDPLSGFGTPQPLSESLIFHPFMLFVGVFPLATSIGLLYLLQMWVALFAVWGCCRQLGLRMSTAALCTATFALSSSAVEYLNGDFWPVVMVGWTLSPLLLLLLLKLFDAQTRSTRLASSLGAGVCAALMLLDGHAGAFPYLALAFVAFLAGEWRRVRELWPWFMLALATFVVGIATKLVDVALEAAREPSDPRLQIHYGFDLWRVFFYPLHSPFGDSTAPSNRLLAIGGPFALLVLLGLFRATGRYVAGLRLVVIVTFAAWFVPLHWLPVLSGNFLTRDPLILFGVLLAGLTLERLWRDWPSRRNLLLGASVLQVVVLVVGFSPSYRSSLQRWRDFRDGNTSVSLKGSLANQPIYRYFEGLTGIHGTRVFLAPQAEDRLWRHRGDYEYAGWSLQGLRLVNGDFRGIDLHEFAPDPYTLHGSIRANPSFAGSDASLDALDVGYVLAAPGEKVSPSLRRIASFTVSGGDTIVAYRNPAAWADAEVLAPRAATMSLPGRPGCATPGLMCADLRPLAALRRPGVQRTAWHGADLAVELTPSSRSRLILLSQAYRPGWEATFGGGAVSGHEIAGGLTAFDVPPGVTHMNVVFRPTGRIVAAIVSWTTLLAAIAVAVGAFLYGRRSRRA